MKTNINIQAIQWLAELGLSKNKITEVIYSFASGTRIQVFRYTAPELFFRFHGKGSPVSIYAPNYWACGSSFGRAISRASHFEGFLNDAEIRQIAKTNYRDVTAICHNWNPLESDTFWKIELAGNETIEGLEGEVAPQPTHAATATNSASTSKLSGGGVQVFLNPETPFICTPVNWENQ
jgi:hypothetical protein